MGHYFLDRQYVCLSISLFIISQYSAFGYLGFASLEKTVLVTEEPGAEFTLFFLVYKNQKKRYCTMYI